MGPEGFLKARIDARGGDRQRRVHSSRLQQRHLAGDVSMGYYGRYGQQGDKHADDQSGAVLAWLQGWFCGGPVWALFVVCLLVHECQLVIKIFTACIHYSTGEAGVPLSL